jgi:hypothetical protein
MGQSPCPDVYPYPYVVVPAARRAEFLSGSTYNVAALRASVCGSDSALRDPGSDLLRLDSESGRFYADFDLVAIVDRVVPMFVYRGDIRSFSVGGEFTGTLERNDHSRVTYYDGSYLPGPWLRADERSVQQMGESRYEAACGAYGNRSTMEHCSVVDAGAFTRVNTAVTLNLADYRAGVVRYAVIAGFYPAVDIVHVRGARCSRYERRRGLLSDYTVCVETTDYEYISTSAGWGGRVRHVDSVMIGAPTWCAEENCPRRLPTLEVGGQTAGMLARITPALSDASAPKWQQVAIYNQTARSVVLGSVGLIPEGQWLDTPVNELSGIRVDPNDCVRGRTLAPRERCFVSLSAQAGATGGNPMLTVTADEVELEGGFDQGEFMAAALILRSEGSLSNEPRDFLPVGVDALRYYSHRPAALIALEAPMAALLAWQGDRWVRRPIPASWSLTGADQIVDINPSSGEALVLHPGSSNLLEYQRWDPSAEAPVILEASALFPEPSAWSAYVGTEVAAVLNLENFCAGGVAPVDRHGTLSSAPFDHLGAVSRYSPAILDRPLGSSGGAQVRIITRWYHEGLDRSCPAAGTPLQNFPLDEGQDRFVEITATYDSGAWSYGEARVVAPRDLAP